MRRPLNWLVVVLSIVVVFVGMSLPGCGGGGGATSEDPPLASGMLRQVRDPAELEDALKRAINQTVAPGVPGGPIAMPGIPTGDFSGTYTVEAGVDELDVVRYDGTHLYVAPQYVDPSLDTAIRILRTDANSATAAQVGSIPLEDQQLVLGMYVADGHLFLVTSEAYFGPYGDVWTTVFVWAPSKFTVQVHDVRDPARPRKLMSATIDGVFVESRRIGDRVVLVSRHAPRAMLDETSLGNLARLPLAELLPAITIDGRTSPLLDPRRCYIANDERRNGYAVLTSITTFSLANLREPSSICYDEPSDGVYASHDALYVSEPRYGTGSSQLTRIHKFSLSGARAEYAGSVELPGTMWGGGQPDFRMQESAGLLRVITSEFTEDASDFQDHRLFVLREKAGERALEIVGRLPNETRPAEIGKPNEALYAVRFVGDRAYAVTFLRIDPLYVIDLSTPTDPRIAGELLIPGVSDFLHPVTEDLLLGLGMDGSHLKLELFDTSVLELPQSRGAITLGGISSGSPALWDRHAFTYLAGDDADRFALPAYVATERPGQAFSYVTSLHQFEVLGKHAPASAILREAGLVTPNQDALSGGLNRAFIHGDAVFFVRDVEVWGTFWSTPSQMNGPF